MINRDLLNPAQQAVLDLITNEQALVAVAFDLNPGVHNTYEIDYSYIDGMFLDQIADPNLNRPSRSETFFEEQEFPRPDILKKMNMRTLKIHDHKAGQNRILKHKDVIFQFTPKTSTSLIPADPRFMELFQCDFGGVGFLWDINRCNTKEEKYVFPVNGGTDDCFWIDLDTDEKIDELKKRISYGLVTTIDSLREKNRNAVASEKSITWNEILAGLPRGNAEAIFSTRDDRSYRLRAYRLMQHTKEKLNLENDLPVFILQPFYAYSDLEKTPDRSAVFRFYQQDEIEADLKAEAEELATINAAETLIKSERALSLIVTDETSLDACLDQVTNPTLTMETFLLPPEPQNLDLSTQKEQGGIGLFWDIEDCTLDAQPSKDAAITLQPGTIEAKLPKGTVSGVYCLAEYDRKARLKAWDMMCHTKERLNLVNDLPIFVIDSSPTSQTFRVYSDNERILDLVDQAWEDCWNNNSNVLHKREDLTKKTATKVAKYFKNASTLFKSHDFVMIERSKPEKEAENVSLLRGCTIS